ncbi:TonB-dependent receptor [Croceibacterium salegens]|nr:TonB-dependent receptor [Croceibacterium salegens]
MFANKVSWWLACGSCIVAPAMAEGAEISIELIDGENKRPIAQAGLLLDDPLEPDAAEPVEVAVSDEAGRAVLTDVPQGRYRLTVTAAGYAPFTTEVLVGRTATALDLGTIALEADSGNRILVQGARQQDVDLGAGVNSYDIANDAIASSGTLLGALGTLPGITVEREGEVLLRGSDRVVILVDGKPSALTGIGNQRGLDSIPAGNVARVEVINNPSARYGAQGGAGIINIVMRESREAGWLGHVGVKGGFGALWRRQDDLPTELGSYTWTPKISPYFSLTHSGASADYQLQGEMLSQRKLPNNEFTTRFYNDGRIIASQVPENRQQTQYILKGGTDQRLSDDDILSISGVFDIEDHLDQAQVPFIETTSNTLTRYWFWRENEQTGHASGALNYRHDFAEAGHNIQLRGEYIRGWEDETYRLNEVSPVRIGTDQTRIVAIENTVPVSLDYVRPLRAGRIELGAKVQWRWIPVEYTTVPGQMSIIYPGLGETSDWRETIYAGYANFVWEPGWLVVEAGLRAEQTSVAYGLDPANIYYPNNDAYDYFRLFPNVRLTKELAGGTDISLFYNRRVDRPGEPELRVFPKYDDPELLKVGNPYLRPQFTTAWELSVQHDFGALSGSLAVYRRRISDAFQRIYAIDASNQTYDIVNKIYANTGVATNIGAELIGYWKPSDKVRLTASFSGYNIHRDETDITLLFPYVRSLTLPETEDFTWDGKIGLELALGNSTQAQVNATYYAPRDIAQGRQDKRGALDLSLTREIGDKWKLSLVANDVFNTFGTRTHVDGVGFDALYENFYETQSVIISVEMEL